MTKKMYAVGDVVLGVPAAMCNHAFAQSVCENWRDFLPFQGSLSECVEAINTEKFGIACVLIDVETGEILWKHVSRESGEWIVSPETV